jgi:hypothetical protein
MSDKLEALKAKKPADTKSLKSQAAGYVTDDNSGGYYVVECQECGEVYPSQECDGGGPIADSGDYNDALCPHCGCESPDECNDTPLVWNVQQAKINALLAALEVKTKAHAAAIEQMHFHEQRAETAEQRLQQPEATQQGVQILTEAIGAHGYIVGCLERKQVGQIRVGPSLDLISVSLQIKTDGERGHEAERISI